MRYISCQCDSAFPILYINLALSFIRLTALFRFCTKTGTKHLTHSEMLCKSKSYSTFRKLIPIDRTDSLFLPDTLRNFRHISFKKTIRLTAPGTINSGDEWFIVSHCDPRHSFLQESSDFLDGLQNHLLARDTSATP